MISSMSVLCDCVLPTAKQYVLFAKQGGKCVDSLISAR